MAAKSKWITSRPEDTSQQVARRALRSRLRRMWYFLKLAVEEPWRDAEHVHQLRVFSRRAAAAMDIFQECLPGRRGRWMHKQVKRVRKASGEARNFDVLLMDWTQRIEQHPSDEAALLLDEVKRRRREAQVPVETTYERLHRKRFAKRISKLVKRVRKLGEPGKCEHEFACMARVALARLVGPYLAAGEAELADAESLHAFRIQGKQVRYAMEVFAGAFDEEFRQELYPRVASLLDRLGAINDHATARACFACWHAETDSCSLRRALEAGMEHEQHLFETSKADFLTWWTFERRQELRDHFARYVQIEPPSDPSAACDPASN